MGKTNAWERRMVKAKMLRFIPDKPYLTMLYRKLTGEKLDWNNLTTFSEKLQWLKLYDHDERYIQMVDKVKAKEYAAKLIGEEHIIPTYGVWDSFDQVDFDSLPDRFVLKCVHDSGGVYYCRDKATMDKAEVRRDLNFSMKNNFYYNGREWPYKFVKPRLIAEKYLDQPGAIDLTDYKIFCFHGEPKFIMVCGEKWVPGHLKMDFYDPDWNFLDIKKTKHIHWTHRLPKPPNLDTMLDIARKLSHDLIFARIDLYDTEDQVWFGEITLYPSSGFEFYEPRVWEERMGEWLGDLEKKR